MNNLIRQIYDETSLVLANITAAVRSGELEWAQGEELKRVVLSDTADAFGLPTLQEILAKWS